MANGHVNNKRSFTGRHTLLPAIKPSGTVLSEYSHQPATAIVAWTFGRGSVIWRIWPAVSFHTLFAALVVFLQMEGYVTLSIPNVMLTVLGVVIGFVISYRAMSGYERYWLGRSCWSDVMKNSRSMGRLIWFHVPPRLSPKTAEETASGRADRSKQEMMKVMAEKQMALDLVEAFAVALKHHIRGEVGFYYEDLYHLVRPLHDHDHTDEQKLAAATSTALPPPGRAHRISSNSSLPKPSPSPPRPAESSRGARTPAIPPINAYGTFTPPKRTASMNSGHVPLQPDAPPAGKTNAIDQVDTELVPFASFFSWIRHLFTRKTSTGYQALPTSAAPNKNPYSSNASQRQWVVPVHPRSGSHKHRPVIAADGQNLPLEILRCLSEWFSVLEDRATVPGTSMGSMIGLISSMEDTLGAMEKILTTPLPFVYSVHIRTVWIYLFFLPFQLVTSFQWFAVPGVCIAAFIYLGFLAAGEEIEQPFGYDENDLDIDMFCKQIIHVDIDHLRKSPCLNAYLPIVRHRSMTLTETTVIGDSESDGEEDEDDQEDALTPIKRTQSPVRA